MNKRILVILAGLMILNASIIASCTQTPAPPVKETVVVKQTVVIPPPTTAPAPTAVPVPPNAEVRVLPVAANATKDPNVITATVKLMTDTAKGEYNAVIAMGTTGLSNVPVNVPVFAECTSEDPKNPGKPAWSLIKPTESKATLAFTNTKQTKFTPDVVGWYVATCNLGGEVGGVQVHAGVYLGNDSENCKTCHANTVTEWAKTGHAKIFTEEIDAKPSHYTESCASCHVTGYYVPPVGNGSGNWKEVKEKAAWKFPTYAEIEAGGNWAKLPAAVKTMSNIQCEQCHGPASEHVKNGEKVMDASMDEGVCNICHNGSSRHDKGEQLKSAGHANKASAAFNEPVGFGEQACVRCHSGNGYASFIKNPTNPAAWDNTKQTIVCATCHDPHSDANVWQLRVMSKPVAMPFAVTKDVGLSATCFECHNSRVSSEAFAAGTSTSTPHYSSIAEMLSDLGGISYGATVPNSPHGALVGVAPIPNPDFAKDPTLNKFLFSAVGDTKGNTPGPCVTCHMYPGITDAKNAAYEKVGGHSFNMVSPDGKLDYSASCKSCHGDVADFNLKAKTDYDGNGKVEGVQNEVKGLLDTIWKNFESKGVKKVATGYPYATLPRGADGKVDPKINNAWFNYRLVYGLMWGTETGNGNEGKAQSVHNFKRSCALLQLSLKDLGALPSGAADCTK